MKELTIDINLDDEASALARYIGLKWTPIAGLDTIVRIVRDAAMHDARALFDQYVVMDWRHKAEDARHAMLAERYPESDPVYIYDALCQVSSQFCYLGDVMRDAALAIDGPWDYERRANQLYREVATQFPDLETARPLGWAELTEDYCDFDGQEEYDPRPDRALFEGVKISSTCSSGFVGRTALPYVAYDEFCQARRAPVVLVGAVYAHFSLIKEWLNSQEIIKAFARLGSWDAPDLVFKLNPVTESPLLTVALQLARPAPTDAEFLSSQEKVRAFRALSAAEQEKIRQVNKAAVAKMLMEPYDQAAADEKRQQQVSQARALLKAALG